MSFTEFFYFKTTKKQKEKEIGVGDLKKREEWAKAFFV